MTGASKLGSCCDQMRYAIHEPRVHISHSRRFREIGILFGDADRHESIYEQITIEYCPWCGSKLPDSLRARYFEEMARLGIEDALFLEADKLPAKYRDSTWYDDVESASDTPPDHDV